MLRERESLKRPETDLRQTLEREMKIECFWQTCSTQTYRQTDKVTPWAPDGAKKVPTNLSSPQCQALLSRIYHLSCCGDCGCYCCWFWHNLRKSNSNFQGGVPSLKSCYFCCDFCCARCCCCCCSGGPWTVPGSGCLNVSGILSKSFSLIRFTVCLYGQGEGVGVVVACPARPGPGKIGGTDQMPARQCLAVIGQPLVYLSSLRSGPCS